MRFFLIVITFSTYIFAQSFLSVHYQYSKDSLTAVLYFDQALKTEQILLLKNNAIEIKNIHSIKPFKKILKSPIQSLDFFSHHQNLYIIPSQESPHHLTFQAKGKTLILTFKPLLKTTLDISNLQYLGVIGVLILLIVFLFYIKRHTKSRINRDYKIQIKKFFIDPKHLIFDLMIENQRYIILSTPKGQILLDKIPTNTPSNDPDLHSDLKKPLKYSNSMPNQENQESTH